MDVCGPRFAMYFSLKPHGLRSNRSIRFRVLLSSSSSSHPSSSIDGTGSGNAFGDVTESESELEVDEEEDSDSDAPIVDRWDVLGLGQAMGAPYRTEPWYEFPDYSGLWWPFTDFSSSLDNGASPAMHALGMVSDSPSSPWKAFPSRLQITAYKTESRLCAAFLANDDPQSDKTVNYNGKSYWLLAWSVIILPGCKNVTLNTAKDVLAMGMKNHKGVD